MKKPWISFVGAIGIAVLLVVSCSRQKTSENTIRIGAMLALTGDSANYGKRSLNGLKWAADKLNAAGGIDGKRIELVVEDSRSSPKDAVSAFNKLLSENLRIVIGDIISGTTLAVAPIAERSHIILFAPGASNPKLRDAGNYVFRNWTSDDYDGLAMAKYLIKKDVTQLGLLVQKTDYTIGLANALTQEFTAHKAENDRNNQIVSRQEFETNDSDLRTQLGKLKEAGARNVYVSAYSPGTGLALKQARELAYLPAWFASLTVETPECGQIAGDARDGVIFTTPTFDINDPRPEMKEFVDGYKSRFGEDPETVAGHAYDALNLICQIAKRVGLDPDNVRDELYHVKDYPGVTGTMTFDDHGDVRKAISIKQFRNGHPIAIDTFNP
jgi:branched-chain amino acid transport system substrate-binding protein